MRNNGFFNKVIEEIMQSGGASVDVKRQIIVQPQDYWMFPKYPSKTRIIPKTMDLKREIDKYLEDCKVQLHEKGVYFGIWLNPKTNEYYLDITMTVGEMKEAILVAKKISIDEGRKIVAIYNPLRNETVYLE